MNSVLEVSNLNKSYGAFALKDVCFSIPAGYIMGFIGPNGAGKTTTIKSILNMVHYEGGQISLFGMDGGDNGGGVNDKIGVVMDAPFYVDEWTMADVEAAVAPFYTAWDSAQYSALLEKFGIERGKQVKELSRGMKVKMMLAVALSHNAKLLILDEPTSGLDPVARDELCEILGEFVADESRSVLFSTHITGDLEKIADYITFILNGKIVFSGLKEELLEKYASVKGGLSDVTAEQKRLIIGLREHSTGFEGMAELSNVGKLPKSLLIEPITLEEIIIFMNKEAKAHE